MGSGDMKRNGFINRARLHGGTVLKFARIVPLYFPVFQPPHRHSHIGRTFQRQLFGNPGSRYCRLFRQYLGHRRLSCVASRELLHFRHAQSARFQPACYQRFRRLLSVRPVCWRTLRTRGAVFKISHGCQLSHDQRTAVPSVVTARMARTALDSLFFRESAGTWMKPAGIAGRSCRSV